MISTIIISFVKIFVYNMIYLISYDLKSPGRNYSELYSAINNLGDVQHPLESVWVVSNEGNAEEIYGKIRPYIDNNDFLFVVRLEESDRQGWLPKSFWEWFSKKR